MVAVYENLRQFNENCKLTHRENVFGMEKLLPFGIGEEQFDLLHEFIMSADASQASEIASLLDLLHKQAVGWLMNRHFWNKHHDIKSVQNFFNQQNWLDFSSYHHHGPEIVAWKELRKAAIEKLKQLTEVKDLPAGLYLMTPSYQATGFSGTLNNIIIESLQLLDKDIQPLVDSDRLINEEKKLVFKVPQEGEASLRHAWNQFIVHYFNHQHKIDQSLAAKVEEIDLREKHPWDYKVRVAFIDFLKSYPENERERMLWLTGSRTVAFFNIQNETVKRDTDEWRKHEIPKDADSIVDIDLSCYKEDGGWPSEKYFILTNIYFYKDEMGKNITDVSSAVRLSGWFGEGRSVKELENEITETFKLAAKAIDAGIDINWATNSYRDTLGREQNNYRRLHIYLGDDVTSEKVNNALKILKLGDFLLTDSQAKAQLSKLRMKQYEIDRKVRDQVSVIEQQAAEEKKREENSLVRWIKKNLQVAK
jgi:hypothetical protein